MLSALLCLTVPTGIFIFNNDDVTESISRCEYKEVEKSIQISRNTKRRRIKIYLKINLPAITSSSNRTKVGNRLNGIEQKLCSKQIGNRQYAINKLFDCQLQIVYCVLNQFFPKALLIASVRFCTCSFS